MNSVDILLVLASAWILIILGIIVCDLLFPSEETKQERYFRQLTKLKEKYDKKQEKENSDWDESVSKLIDEAIQRAKNHKDIDMKDINIANALIQCINDCIKMYTYECLSTKFFVREKIEITTLDEAVKYVSSKTFDAFSPNAFEINGIYSRNYYIDYIVKETRVYVTQTVIEYNINLSQQL